MKHTKAISIFFLVSFFISISTNICLASFVAPSKSISLHTKDHLRVNESVLTSNINDILFEENENENENELEFDLALILIPFFLETFNFQTLQDHFIDPSSIVIPTGEPIYIQVSNFRI